MRFQYSFKLDEQNYYDFNKYYSISSAQSKNHKIVIRYMYPIIFLVVFGSVFIRKFEMPFAIAYTLLFTAAFISFGVLWFKLFKRLEDKRLRKTIHSLNENGKLNCDEIMLTFEDEFIISTTKDIDSKSTYSVVKKIDVAESAVYVHLNSTISYIIPKSVFKDEQEISDFVSFINTKINFA